MSFNWLQIILSAFAGGLVMFIFNRFARSLDLGFAKEERTEGRIEKVDSQARASISRVENELRQSHDELKSGVAGQVMDLAVRLARVEETVRHLPSAEQIDKLIDRLALVEREVGSVSTKVEGQSEMVRFIRDHVASLERR